MENHNLTLLRALALSVPNVCASALVLNDCVPEPLPLGPTVTIIPCGTSAHRSIAKVRFAARAMVHCWREKPDLIVCGHVNFLFLCSWLKRIYGIDYIVLVYGVEVWNLSAARCRRLAQARCIWSISQFTRDRVNEQLGSRVIIDLLPCTVDSDRFIPLTRPQALAQKYGIGDRKVILSVGRLAEGYKGYDVVIRALATLVHSGIRACYLLVGSGPQLEVLRRLARSLGIEDSVIFAGYVAERDLVDHYALCDVFALPSKGEGFGIVYLEALSCGKPVIAGNRDASPEPLLNGKLGQLVDPDNVEQVAEAIRKTLCRELDAAQLDPVRLRRLTIEHFGLDRFRSRVKQIFLSLASST